MKYPSRQVILCCLVAFCLFMGVNNHSIAKNRIIRHLEVAESLLILEDITHPNDVYLFTKDDTQSLNYKFYNPSTKAVEVSYSITLFSHSEKEVLRRSGDFSVAGNSRITQKLVDKTSSLPYGVYYAKLEVFEKSSGKKILEKKTYFGVTSSTHLRKAADDEFLFGMDVTLGQFFENDYLLKWMDYTGTDIVRLGVYSKNMSDVDRYYPIYKKHNLRLGITYDPPHDKDSLTRRNKLKANCDFIEELARKYPEFKYYELGNEPDLKGFYPGPIEEYASATKEMYKAIKRGNPNTIVMNGGLCFFGDEGFERANRYLEVVDTNYIDAFAYHAHGFGSVAERAGYNIITKALAKVNKGNKMLFDTESGSPTVTTEQEKMQAATALQKQVFAQSVGLGYLMWFRFLMFEEPYGNIYSLREPRPVVIAYRNMVETLRGHKFDKIIETGKKGTETYLFKQKNGNGRLLIAWVNDPVNYNVTMKLGAANSHIENLESIDLYGNIKPVGKLSDGALRLAINENPVYIRWNAKEPSFVVTKGVPVIDVQPEILLGLNAANTIDLVLKNPENKSVNAQINLNNNTSFPINFNPAVITVTLKPGEVKSLKISAFPKLNAQQIIWPQEWTIFTWLNNYNPEGVLSIPKLIKDKDSVIEGYKVNMESNIIDFVKITGKWKEKAVAVAFAEIQSNEDTVVSIGTAADWWMDWYVNGKPVYNTLEKGNQGTMSIAEHTFKIKLNKGKNIIAAKVLSGLGGWKFAFGAGQELLNVKNKTQDHLEITFKSGNTIIETEKSLVKFIKPISWVPEKKITGSELKNWNYEVPSAVIKEKGVFNFFDKFPDNTKWWKGEADLSSKVWLRQDEENLNIIVQVMDDKHSEPKVQADIINNDAVMVAFFDKASNVSTEYIVSSLNNKAFVGKFDRHYLTGKVSPETSIKANVSRENGLTWYQISFPKNQFIGKENSMNLLINDGDWGKRKQYMEWFPGLGDKLDTDLWYKLVF